MAKSRRVVVGIGVLGMVLASCGSGSSSSEASSAEQESPLAEALGFDFDNPEQFEEQERAAEQAMKECMNAQGFDYEVRTTSMNASGSFSDQLTMSEEDYAAAHGYGIADSMLEFEEQQADFEDPNAEMLDAMSETEREAWFAAAYGAEPEPLPDEGEEDVGFELDGGCAEQAWNDSASQWQKIEQLMPQLEAMDEAFNADPRVAEARQQWSSCMKDKGYDFTEYDDGWREISDRVNAVAMESPDAPQDGTLDENSFFLPTELSPEAKEQLEEIRTEEIKVATADVGCLNSGDENLDDIQREYELNFIEENKAVLEAE